MPLRLQVKGPGEFVRDHLQEVGGIDYIQAIFRAYKAYLRANEVRPPHRQYFGNLIWELKELGALRFDHAEGPQGWRGLGEEAESPPRGYRPAAGSPAPRHFYRLVDPASMAFSRPHAEFLRSRGLPVPAALPRLLVPRPTKAPPAPRPRRPRRPRAEMPTPLEQRVAQLISILPEIRAARDPLALVALGKGLLDLSQEAQAAARAARGAQRERLGALSGRLVSAAEYAGLARSALEILARETLPLRQAAAERSWVSAWSLLTQALSP